MISEQNAMRCSTAQFGCSVRLGRQLGLCRSLDVPQKVKDEEEGENNRESEIKEAEQRSAATSDLKHC